MLAGKPVLMLVDVLEHIANGYKYTVINRDQSAISEGMARGRNIRRSNEDSSEKSVEESVKSPKMNRKRSSKKSKKKTACFKTITATKWLFYIAWAAALGYTLFNISKSLDKFLSKPVSTKITIYHNEDGKMRFPTISLCNLNRVNESYLVKNGLLNELWHNITSWGHINWTAPGVAEFGEIIYQDMFRNSPSWDKTMMFCSYAGVRECSKISVFQNISNMIEEELSPTGKCYRFNPKGRLYSKAGDYGSVYLRLNINLREYLDKSENGFVMAIHHHTQYSSTRNTGIVMSPGFKYRINIKALQRKELPVEEGGKCNPSLETNSYGAYDLESCHTECRDRELNSSCGCIPVLPPRNIYNYRPCTLQEMHECGNGAYLSFVKNESSTERNNTCPGCWVPCTHYSYELSTATTAISKEYAESKAASSEGKRLNFTSEDVLNNNIIMEAYFRDMYVQEISQIPEYSFWNLLADIGGMLGLFLGASIFTIIDFIRYALNYTYLEFKTRYGSTDSRSNSREKVNKTNIDKTSDSVGYSGSYRDIITDKHDLISDIKNSSTKINSSSRRDSAASSSCPEEEDLRNQDFQTRTTDYTETENTVNTNDQRNVYQII